MTARHTIGDFVLDKHPDLSSLKCRLAEQVYHKYIRDAYGIKDCCMEYNHAEVKDLKLLINLYGSGHSCLSLIQGNAKVAKKQHHKNNNILNPEPYIFIQSIPSTIWIINHGLKRNPNITVLDFENHVIVPLLVEYLDINTVRITFLVDSTGKAYLS